jgi:Rps23 Pro-64 3,4-dihydroxylase Tpa1-like proline 4-hydroxylase
MARESRVPAGTVRGVHIERDSGDSDSSYVVRDRTEAELARLSAAFSRDHAVRVEALLGPRLLNDLRAQIAVAAWAERDDAAIARESTMQARGLVARIVFMVNDPRVLTFTRAVTGAADVELFSGRIYRFAAGGSHFDSWHDDNANGRRVALSLNLSDGPIDGGELKLRTKGSETAATFAYGHPGDALFFRIAAVLEHQVQRVTSATPRTALAGWFCVAEPVPGQPAET